MLGRFRFDTPRIVLPTADSSAFRPRAPFHNLWRSGAASPDPGCRLPASSSLHRPAAGRCPPSPSSASPCPGVTWGVLHRLFPKPHRSQLLDLKWIVSVSGLDGGPAPRRLVPRWARALLRPVASVSPVRSASLTTRQRVGRGACGFCVHGGQPPSRRPGSARSETPGCLTGAPRAGSGGKPQEGRGSGDGSPDRDAQECLEAQATPRLSRGAAEPKCVQEGRRRRWPWRSGESPGEAESQESIGLTAGRQPRGVRT